MKKQTETLIEIGAVYLAASIVVESLLSTYRILVLPILSFIFALFAMMMVQVLWQPTVQGRSKKIVKSPMKNDDLTRLEHLCTFAIDQGDEKAAGLLSERVRRMAFDAASLRLNISAASLRRLADEQRGLVASQVNDALMTHILTSNGSFIRNDVPGVLNEYLAMIEGWIS
jgi:hypothetical protein